VVEYAEFLSLSFEEVIKLISSDDISIPLEEKVSKPKLIMLYFNIVDEDQ